VGALTIFASASTTMATTIDAYLTGKARAAWPDSVVVRVDDEHGTRFILQRPGKPDLGLGNEFYAARRALYAARDHHKAGGSI
jgi:hypothetical protein